ncbi:OLC1v1009319C1 [Oldenlandia corymbosa var. corymbosa]|uniref:OLC1v1009319C1 n=1 Tax=Oldenlandia corymbosa var. corymbosa TaxID=529605 RepID=A0AAV1DNR3_OLDCO|nr:OLC1v1009319C1 [Oldenlandia corymbosa var. corymbosa]
METTGPTAVDENSLQTFYVRHKASHPARKICGKVKRKIDSSPKGDLSKKNNGTTESIDCFELGLQNFRLFWSKIEATIKDVLRDINAGEFDKINSWIRQSFDVISSCTVSDPTQITSSYPLLVPAKHRTSSKQIFAGLVCTKNLESVDDILTFEDLAEHLKSHGHHVANLSSLDFSLKNGIGGCLLNLLQQFITVSIDAADMSVLASWYCEQGSCKRPIIVIIDGLERCCQSVLSEFIIILSEWATKVPIILVLGVTTTADALRDILPSYILQYLSLSKFVLESPTERMDAIIASVVVQYASCFSLGHDVATFLRKYFLRQDGTLTSFVRALKVGMQLSIEAQSCKQNSGKHSEQFPSALLAISFSHKLAALQMACFQHFVMYPSRLQKSRSLEKKCPQELSYGNIVSLQERIIKQAFGLPDHQRNNQAEPDGDIGHGLCEMQNQFTVWRSLIMCISEALKYTKATLLEVYCEILNPQPNKSGTSSKIEWEHNGSTSSTSHCMLGQHSCLQKCGSVCQAICRLSCILRDLSPLELHELLIKWEELTEGITEVQEKIKGLKVSMSTVDIKALPMHAPDISKRRTTRGNIIAEKDSVNFNEKAARLAGCLMKEYMQPVECFPLHELIQFNNVEELQSALMGDPRRRIQIDLLESQKFLKCKCCSRNEGASVPSTHDTAIMYGLAQEHGDLINLHNWYQSFKTTISHSGTGNKTKLKSSSPKKRKVSADPQNISDASIQARFCRAISELQITGLLRMPSKRRPDFVQRVAFGV